MANTITITIDGPAYSGKSSAAKMLAKELGYYYLNSGLLYRAIAYIIIDELGLSLEQAINLTKDGLQDILSLKQIDYKYLDSQAFIYYKDKDITKYLKDSKVDNWSSVLSTNLAIREELTRYQRSIASNNSIVVEGRDAGSVVFPNANYKFFLTATIKVRAERFQKYQKSKNNNYSLEESKELIKKRDYRDQNRKVAPLIIPESAIIVDNSNLDLSQTVDLIKSKIK